MDARVENKMRTFLHKDKHNNKYKIGICYGKDDALKEPNHIIIFIDCIFIKQFII